MIGNAKRIRCYLTECPHILVHYKEKPCNECEHNPISRRRK